MVIGALRGRWVFEWVSAFFKSHSVMRSLKKKASARILYSTSTDCYVIHAISIDTKTEYLVDEYSGSTLHGRVWDGKSFSTRTRIKDPDFRNFSLKIFRFYGYFQIEYQSTPDFWQRELLLYPQRLWLNERLRQAIYNVSTKFRHDRVYVIKRIVEKHLGENLEGGELLHTPKVKSAIQLFSEVYGNRAYSHPNYERASKEFRLIIESLAVSGELKEDAKHTYRLTGKALIMISNYELDERRHSDSVFHNRLLLLLTMILAVAAVAQVGVSSGWFAD